MRDEMLPEMTRHFNRWGYMSPAPGFIGRSNDVPSWESNIDTMLFFSDTRIGIARNQIQSQFALNKQVNVTLDVFPAGAGTIKISTVTPETLPWTGVYFDGNPVTITATANPGYEFKYWAANKNISSDYFMPGIHLNIDSSDTFTAHFDQLELGLNVYPNPFSSILNINYQLPKSMQVSIKLYTMLGQQLAQIVSPDALQQEGDYTIPFDPASLSLAQGIYFIELKTNDFTKRVKLVRTKGN
jgi:hypothetical protein